MTSSKLSPARVQKKSTPKNACYTPINNVFYPHPANTKLIKSKLNYASMWKAIQRIKNPVSFDSLKQFYGMSYPMRSL